MTEVSSTVQIAVISTAVVSFTFMNMFDVNEALRSQFYAMLNAQQLIVFMPILEKLLFPANAELINAVLLSLATFSWIPTQWINEHLYRLPEIDDADPLDKFSHYDYLSTLLIENMGQGLLMIAFYAFLIIIYLCFHYFKTVRRKLATILFWNGLIRLFMELYEEAALLCLHNLKSIEWPGSMLHTASNILAILFAISVWLVPLSMVIFY